MLYPYNLIGKPEADVPVLCSGSSTEMRLITRDYKE